MFSLEGRYNDVTNTLALTAQWSAGTASTTIIHHSQNNKRSLLITASRPLVVPCNRASTSSHDPASTDQWRAGAAHTAVPKASSSTEDNSSDGSLTTFLNSVMTYGCCRRNRRHRATSAMLPSMLSARWVLQSMGKGSDSWYMSAGHNDREERHDRLSGASSESCR